jgi:hypothetical protein
MDLEENEIVIRFDKLMNSRPLRWLSFFLFNCPVLLPSP